MTPPQRGVFCHPTPHPEPMTRKARTAQPKGHAPGSAAAPNPEPTTFAEAFRRLNAQRKKFVGSYLERPNATRAAKAAGYSEKTARSQGQRLLTFVDIRAALRLGWDEAGMSPSEVRARTEEIARASLEDFFSFEQVLSRPLVQRRVSDLLTELFAEIDFEEKYARRAQLTEDEQAAHDQAQQRRRREAIRMELEMEANPKATRWVPGEPVPREVERLDLARARDLGVLHLLKSVRYTRFGPAVELEDRAQARQLIGRLHGLWAKDEEGPDSAQGLPEHTSLEDATDEQLAAEIRKLLGEDAL